MSLLEFVILQLTMITMGVAVAFALRGRALSVQYRLLAEQLMSEPSAAGASETVASPPSDAQWLQARLQEVTGDDTISAVRRLVLSNELSPADDFEETLTERYLTTKMSNSGDQENTREHWISVRQASIALAAEMIEKYPLSAPVVTQLHESYAELDEVFDFEIPGLPEPPEVSALADDDASAGEQAEHLRSANEQLQREVEKLREALAQAPAGGETPAAEGAPAAGATTAAGEAPAAGQEATTDAPAAAEKQQTDDLKMLLQQFTSDSRDMMACIQKMETENAVLRQKLGLEPQDEVV